MQMKPVHSFLFISVVLAVIIVLPILFPKGEIRMAGLEIRIYQPQSPLIPQRGTLDTKNTASAHQTRSPQIPQRGTLNTENTASLGQTNSSLIPQRGTLDAENTASVDQTNSPQIPPRENLDAENTAAKDYTTISTTAIEIPGQTSSLWAKLHETIVNAGNDTKPLRILYYGDSQIENDHITSVFRKVLQEQYGGSGRGLIPVSNIYNTPNNFVMTVSDNWESASVVKSKQTGLDAGLLCQAYKIKKTATAEAADAQSWVKIKSLKNGQPQGYTELSVFYRATGKSEISLEVNQNQCFTTPLESSDQINEFRFDIGATPESVDIKFRTSSEITVYGLNLESAGGVMVDNIALRGRSTPELSRIDSTRLKQMAKLLNPAVVVLQYGVNVVPNITSNYSFYKKQMNSELATIRKIFPGIPVVMVGVSDMARKANGLLESYPNLETILNTQKEVAIENGCAFWNLFESMGGRGSMISWVEKQPPLGNKDYVHYTSLGAEKVGNLFARQFIKVLESEQATALLTHEP